MKNQSLLSSIPPDETYLLEILNNGMSPVIHHLSIPITILSVLRILSTLRKSSSPIHHSTIPPYCHLPHTSSSFSIHLLHPMIPNLSTQPLISNYLVYLYKGSLNERALSSEYILSTIHLSDHKASNLLLNTNIPKEWNALKRSKEVSGLHHKLTAFTLE